MSGHLGFRQPMESIVTKTLNTSEIANDVTLIEYQKKLRIEWINYEKQIYTLFLKYRGHDIVNKWKLNNNYV